LLDGAGRVQKGRCYRLITKGTYEKLPEHSVPEILRVPLEKVVLQVKAMLSDGAAKQIAGKQASGQKSLTADEGRAKASSMTLLCRCPDVPPEASVQAAEQLLVQIQALNADTGLLTPLGRHLSTLPCMPRVGKLCIYGALLSCVYPATAVAACMTVRSPFLSSSDPELQRKVRAAKVTTFDMLFGFIPHTFDVMFTLVWCRTSSPATRRFDRTTRC
jgi:HrpA-like RNA helicase